MNFSVSKLERKAIYADLKTDYLYVAIPFMILIGIKLYLGTWQEIVLSPDWSLASCLVFGQITSKVSKAVAGSTIKTSSQHFGLYTAKRFFFVVVSIIFYCGMLAKPSLTLGYAQIMLFITASYFHFSDGYTTSLLQKNV
ncbi:hypothetical protein GV054_21150 [Marinomonas mediterranea]|uniref:hypothetical protein n=1 Tax=Marinomonas mediterranea TaxID=119864 RepID=UPI00234B3EB8|nr:hypothetical protein [Marinomonas mediterranea]WCN15335.1 hypothetical protein GV054_21150 [Marinomonas mediterranea]